MKMYQQPSIMFLAFDEQDLLTASVGLKFGFGFGGDGENSEGENLGW